jgi:16S rRNA (cytosine967-C5)-methyltransferase
VDAPCTGLGTLRRSPHLKWTTTPVAIRDAAEAQLAILNAAVPKLKPGGHLIYATCSVTREENEGVVGRFLEQNPGFATVCQRAILPSEHDTDAYFTATFRLRMERLGG